MRGHPRVLPVTFFTLVADHFLRTYCTSTSAVDTKGSYTPTIAAIFYAAARVYAKAVAICRGIGMAIADAQAILRIAYPPVGDGPPVVRIFYARVPELYKPTIRRVVPIRAIAYATAAAITIDGAVSLGSDMALAIAGAGASLHILYPASSAYPGRSIGYQALANIRTDPALETYQKYMKTGERRDEGHPYLLSKNGYPYTHRNVSYGYTHRNVSYGYIHRKTGGRYYG